MNPSGMSKEQKQYVVLGALVGAILLYSLTTLVLGPLQRNWAQAREEIKELEAKTAEASRLIRNRAALSADLAESSAAVGTAAAEFIPDPANPLAWATLALYAVGREVGLDIRAVSEISAPQVLLAQGKDGIRQFGAYAVRIDAQCNFALLRKFLGALEESNPYLCVSGIAVQGRPEQPEEHVTNLTLEWPAWIDRSAPAPRPGRKGA